VALLGWFSTSYAVFLLYQYLNRVAYENSLTKILSINLVTDLWLFILGVGAALYWDKVKHIFERRLGYWLLAYLALALLQISLFGTPVIGARFNMPHALVWGVLLAGVVLSFAFTSRTMASVLRGNDFSYGIYLYHELIIITLARHQFTNSIASVALIVFGTCVLAASSWYCIERPALASKRGVTDLVARRLRSAERVA
jgi:peptidoglycan/LPS O-acetylase OafA/YrhL